MDGLTEGRIVHYVLTDMDVKNINHLRETPRGETWSDRAQAHSGNSVMAGEHFPAMVVRVWPHEYGDRPGVNLQVFLDGNDSYWVTSARFAEPAALELGTCHWIEKA